MSTPTTASAFVASLPSVSPHRLAEINYDLECPICKVEYEMEYFAKHPVYTPCNHVFHSPCLQEWCLSHASCPMCRRILFESAGPEPCQDLGVEGINWPRDDDGTLQWLNFFVYLNFVRTDLELYQELQRKGFFPEAVLDPGATMLDEAQELALWWLFHHRGAFARFADERWEEYTDVERIASMRGGSLNWVCDREKWLLAEAFPRYHPEWYMRDFA